MVGRWVCSFLKIYRMTDTDDNMKGFEESKDKAPANVGYLIGKSYEEVGEAMEEAAEALKKLGAEERRVSNQMPQYQRIPEVRPEGLVKREKRKKKKRRVKNRMRKKSVKKNRRRKK